jgi:prepilin-type N-terminal cleavage/methylation domain-containing protein
MNTYIKDRRDEGFTLIELLIAIVVVGILTAVVIVGIGGLTDNGKNGACAATADAAKAATAVYYNNQTPNAYPADLKAMVDEGDLDKPDSVAYGAGNMSFTNGWVMTMHAPDATHPGPYFTCA